MRKKAPPLHPALRFLQVLWAVDHRLQEASKRMTRELGVTGPQRMVIRMVALHPDISAGELAELLHLHPSTLTGVLHRLVQRGYLSRATDPTDARRALFRLGPKGPRVNNRLQGTAEGAVRKALANVPPAHVATAMSVLLSIATALE